MNERERGGGGEEARLGEERKRRKNERCGETERERMVMVRL